MAKRFVLDALVKVLGEFVYITEENLNLGVAVWSGKIVLNNLRLKTEKLLQSFNLCIHNGLIQSLEVIIPWTALFSSPVKIIIDGVYLQVGPLNPHQLTAKDRRKRHLERKREKLKFADKFFESSQLTETEIDDPKHSKTSKSSYVQQFTAKIIDNLEINLKHVHIRYEDSFTLPGKVISAGITLSSFILATCDEHWKAAFVARSTSQKNSKLHKIAEAKGFSIYWNTVSESFSSYTYDDWVAVMSRTVAIENMTVPIRGIKYILAPKNILTIKLIHHEEYSESVPKFFVMIDCTNLPLSVDLVQYLQLRAVINNVVYENQPHGKYSLSYRPKMRPSSGESARLWWKYCCKLAIRQPKYIHLFILMKMNEKFKDGSKGTISDYQLKQLEHLEERIPLHILTLFRQKAFKEISELVKSHRALATPASSSNSSKWWYPISAEVKADVVGASASDDDVPLATILEELKTNQSVASTVSADLIAAIHLNSSSSLELSIEGKAVIRSAMSLSITTKLSSLGIFSQIDLVDFLVEDKFTPSPPLRNLISVRHRHRSRQAVDQKDIVVDTAFGSQQNLTPKVSSLTVIIEKYKDKTSIKVTSHPFIFCLNKDCFQVLMAMLSVPNPFDVVHPNAEPNISTDSYLESSESNKRTKQSQYDIEVKFEAHAPKIIIPEHSSSDSGYLLLDTGFLEVKGIVGANGMSWEVKLRDVNAAMPLSVRDLYSFDSKSLYLIKPFDIGVDVQTFDKKEAAMTVDMSITPQLRGELDTKRLSRLFHIIQVVTVTFTQWPSIDIDTNISRSHSSEVFSMIHASTDDTVEEDGLVYGTARASPIEFVNTLDTIQSAEHQQSLLISKRVLSEKSETSSLSDFRSIPESTKSVIQPNIPDPYHVVRRIVCKLPEVVIDLAYDTKHRGHIIFKLSQTSVFVKSRPYDMQVLLNVNAVSIEDSCRADNQRFVAKTPRDCQFIDIAYTNISSSLSPLYKNHASEVNVNFASLALNFDVKTLSHLKPFLEIVIHLRGGNQEVLNEHIHHSGIKFGESSRVSSRPSQDNVKEGRLSLTNTIVAALQSVRNIAIINPEFPKTEKVVDCNIDTPTGMIISLNISEISLNILRESSSDLVGIKLDSAFSLRVSSLRTIIDMKDLLSSDVKLKSFVIFDTREASKEYAYRTIFCPIFDNNLVPQTSFETINKENSSREISTTDDLLQIIYKQDSELSAFTNVVVSNTTSFVAIDTILDFADVLMANFFGVLDLLAAPGPVKQNQLLAQYLVHYKAVDGLQSTINSSKKEISTCGSTSDLVEMSTYNAYTLNVSVRVNNPRLIILEDPTSETSQAIIGRCEVEVHFARETRTFPNIKELANIKELHESLHLSVKKMELFVVETILQIEDFRSILEPFGLEYHLRRRIRGSRQLSTQMSMDVDDVNARISIKDIALIQSILQRRFSTPSTEDDLNETIKDDSNSRNNQKIMKNADVQSPNEDGHSFSVVLTSRPITIIAVDDTVGKSVPFLMSSFENLSFSAETNTPNKITGEGTFMCQTDFYNTNLDTWEPVLEKWKPSLNVSSEDNAVTIELSCSHTLQVTLSSFVLHKLSQTLLLLTNPDFSYGKTLQMTDSVSNVTLINMLGENVDVEVVDSSSRKTLLLLTGAGDSSRGLIKKASNIFDDRSSLRNTSGDLPSSVDLYLKGVLDQKRKPVLHVPFNITRPKLCNLIPSDLGNTEKDFEQRKLKSKRVILLEPIIEEAYENARYEPLSGKWRKPFMFGDPEEFTDAALLNHRPLHAISINEEEWEWQDNWAVDMTGQLGIDFDEEGWEYSTSFQSFSIASKRRSKSPMDCVRRRRWIRTRVPKKMIEDIQSRPLSIFWDVKVDRSGCREVQIRSGLIIRNSMPFSMEISLHHKSWDNCDVIHGPIAPENIFSVPLLRSFASSISVRPTNDSFSQYPGYSWSKKVNCNMQQFDFSSIRDTYCNFTSSDGRNQVIVMRVKLQQINKCLEIDFEPFVIIVNSLPCDLRYRISSRENKRETGMLLSGGTGKLIHVDTSLPPVITFRVGKFSWSNSHYVDLDESINHRNMFFELTKKQTSNTVGAVSDENQEENESKMILTAQIRHGKRSRYEVTIFSQSAIIDHTGLDVSVWCNIDNKFATTVRTYSATKQLISESEKPHTNFTNRGSEFDIYSVYPDKSQHTMDASSVRSSHHNIIEATKLDRNQSVDSLSDYGKKISDFGDEFLKSYQDSFESDSAKDKNSSNIETEIDMSVDNSIIRDLTVKSNHPYIVTSIKEGSFVYSDKKLRWCYIPAILRRCQSLYIRTPDNDAFSRGKDLISFRLVTPSIMILMIDRNIVRSIPKWITEQGFERIVDEAVARKTDDNQCDVFYSLYGKYYSLRGTGEEWVYLHGNWNKERGKMYCVAIVPDPRSEPSQSGINMPLNRNAITSNETEFNKIMDEISFQDRYDRAMACKSWIDGAYGLGLFHTYNDIVSIGILQEKVWSSGVNINTQSGAPSHGYFEISEWSSNKEYQLSYKIDRMPGLFHHTQTLTVMSRYCIVNCMNEPLLVNQKGASSTQKGFLVRPFHVEPWHKIDSSLTNHLHFRTQMTTWSLGFIDINEIGSSVLHLPYRSALVKVLSTSLSDSSSKASDYMYKEPFVIHVDVKEADASEKCAVVIVVWKASVSSHTAALSIKNESDVPVAVSQANAFYDVQGSDSSLFDIVVSPGKWIPFGWADPDLGANICIVVGDSLRGSNSRRVATISFLKTGDIIRLPDQSNRIGRAGEVLISIVAQGHGRILKITRMKGDQSIALDSSSSKSDPTSGLECATFDKSSAIIEFRVKLSSYGLSLVLDKPTRREFLSLYLDSLDMSLKSSSQLRTFQLNVVDMQIDNYAENRIYPVLLRSKKKEIHRSIQMTNDDESNREDELTTSQQFDEDERGSLEIPLIAVSIIQELSLDYQSSPFFRYAAFRLLPIYLEVDSASIQILFADLIDDFKLLSTSQIFATMNPINWIDDYSKKLLSPYYRLSNVDIYQTQKSSQRSKIYFQKLIVHPIKLFLTIVPTPDYAHKSENETIQSTFSNVFKSFAAVDRVQLKLRSFEVEDAMETKTSLIYLIGSQLRQDINSNIGQLFGSLAVLGSPMGFARKVGRGVKAFFYEPYLGLVQSPQDFLLGIGKGTSSLVTGVVSGAMNSTVAIVGTATKGISYLSGDSEYVRKRALKRELHRNSRRGVIDGIFDGGESLLSGLTSGMAGLVTKPLEEARRDGAVGFIRGIGLGLVGAAVKPVMGFTDGIASVANGISNSVGDNSACDHVRPARVFDRSLSDSSDLIIRPLNLDAAFAQDFVLKRARHHSYQDSFLTFISMDSQGGSAVILSEVYVYWRKPKSLWGRTWSNISHIVYFRNEVGIMMYASNEKNKPEAFSIPCDNQLKTIEVYTALANNAHRMGNPSLVIPYHLVEQYGLHLIKDKANDLRKIFKGQGNFSTLNLAGELDGYRFGSANMMKLPAITGPERDVLKRCEHYLNLPYTSLRTLDDRLWRLIWEWECTHVGLNACRCCITLILNRSDTPIQIGKIQIIHGRNLLIIGSSTIGYEEESRCIQPDGSVTIFFWAFPLTPIEIGHVKAVINTAEFIVTVASVQRESSCLSQGGLSVVFLEKTVAEWWSKYVVLIEN